MTEEIMPGIVNSGNGSVYALVVRNGVKENLCFSTDLIRLGALLQMPVEEGGLGKKLNMNNISFITGAEVCADTIVEEINYNDFLSFVDAARDFKRMREVKY